MRQLIYLGSAYQDLLNIQRYIARESGHVSVGSRFAAQIHQQCSKLASLPGTLGRPRPEFRHDIRSFPFKGYIVFFRYVADTFEVVNILQGNRDIDAFFRQDGTDDTDP